MLGDRGTWFKMSFFERSARVPLVMAGPDVAPGTAPDVCSLLDLPATLSDIAGISPSEYGVPLGGRSLWPTAAGDRRASGAGCASNGDGRGAVGSHAGGEAIGEYMGEMTSHPIFMIRRGRYKYICCETDPPLLYDIVADPAEHRNLADPAEHRAEAEPTDGAEPPATEPLAGTETPGTEPPAGTETPGSGTAAGADRPQSLAALTAAFAAEAAERWDSAAIRSEVIASQRARRAVHAASPLGWDFAPRTDPARVYIRDHMDWAEAGPRLRFPSR